MNRERRGDVGKPGGGSSVTAEPIGVPGKTTLTSGLPPILSSVPKATSGASHEASTGGALPVQRKTTIDGALGPQPKTDEQPTPPAANDRPPQPTVVEARGGSSLSPSGSSMTSPKAGARGIPFLQLKSNPSPVQRKGADDLPAAAPAEVAAQGVVGGGSSLPHLAQIQASFGRHNVSGVTAHQGPATSEAAQGLGARAFAFGNAVGFDGVPDLHTAAHEAAHVVQQRGGVQLKGGIDGGASDPFERHADHVADAVVAGRSAEPLLDQVTTGELGAAGAAVRTAVQRKENAVKEHAVSSSVAHDDGPPTKVPPHAKWPVFADTDKPYKIVSAKDPVRLWVVRDWIRSGDGFEASGNLARSPVCAKEILEALGWVPKERIGVAAANMWFDLARPVIACQFAAKVFCWTGLPTSRPVVSRMPLGMVEVASRLDDQDAPPGTVEPDDAQRLEVIRALASFTGLAPVSGAPHALKSDLRLHIVPVQSGVMLWRIDKETGNGIFGFDEDSDPEKPAGPYARWLDGKNAKQQPRPKAHDNSAKDERRSAAHDKPNLKLNNYYGVPIPGTLRTNRQLIEAGQPVWLKVAVQWPGNVPSAQEYEIVPMATADQRGGEVACLSCAWHIEQVGGAAAGPSTPAAGAPTAAGASAAAGASTAAAGSATSAGGTPATTSADGRAGAGSGAAPPTAPSAAPSAASWGATPVSSVSSGTTATTDVAELHHVFLLPPGQDSGTFRVTVQASLDAYFEPATFTTTVEVKSTAAAMQGLRDAAFGELAAHPPPSRPESFDSTGRGDDTEGWRTDGQLPASFTPSGLDMPDSRAAGRTGERRRLEATKMYLQANGASPDVLAAVDRALAASRVTEDALSSDRSKGWQPFQIRGTYLSREDDVPSGPLTLYGTVHAVAPHSSAGGEVTYDAPGAVAVQIRDLSRRFDNDDLTFTGQGQTFEAALKAAFVDNAKAYPAGVMAIEAEAIDAGVTGDYAAIGKATGKTIGFQLGTDSRWKRVKDKVWSPVVNTVVNLGAMALMAFVPGSAVIVAPLLIAYNSAPTIDRIRGKSESGTLTLGETATSVGEIALNLLPMVGRAKAFTAGWFALEGANWGGQAVLLTASAIQTARALQAHDVEALAALYDELQQLEAAATNPQATETKREQVIARAKAVSQRIEEQIEGQIATNAMFAVAGSVIHRASTLNEAGRARMVDAYLRSRGATTGEPQTASATQEDGPRVADRNTEHVEPATHHDTGRGATDQASSGATSDGPGQDTRETERGVPDPPKPPHAPSPVLDGTAIAAQVPGTTYEAAGTFRIKTAHGKVEVAMRRTSGAARVVRSGDRITIEIPRGLTGSALEHAIIDQLRAASAELARGHGTASDAGAQHADKSTSPEASDGSSTGDSNHEPSTSHKPPAAADSRSASRETGGEPDAEGKDTTSTASIKDPTKAPETPTLTGRVTEPIPGLYDSIDPNVTPAGWHFSDTPSHEHRGHPGWVQIKTEIVAPDGSFGWIERSYDPKAKTLVMENAFLKELPGWIEAGKPLKDGRGTPTVAYLTMRQMKMLGVTFGETKVVKMSTIQNIEAVMQLEQMKRKGIPYEQGIAKTHSVTYATTSIQQSGQMITDVKIDTSGAWPWRLSEMMDHFQMPEGERQALFAKYGLTPNDDVMVNYDVYIDVAPYPKKP